MKIIILIPKKTCKLCMAKGFQNNIWQWHVWRWKLTWPGTFQNMLQRNHPMTSLPLVEHFILVKSGRVSGFRL
jgi:hypothetical protein